MTATTTRPSRETDAAGSGGRPLAGLGSLVRFDLRRDRIRIPLWLATVTVLTVATAGAYADLYPTAAARQQAGEALATPAGLAMTGPVEYLAADHFGALMGLQMLGFTAVLAAVMSVLLVVRHTRAEEQTGRAELIRANVVGRHAHLGAALVCAVVANLGLGLLLWVGLGALGLEGMTWSGSLLYGVAHAAVGITFAGVAGVTAQVTEHARGASGMALSLVGLAYVLRATGDAGGGALSWLSPIGWAQGTYVYVTNRWWPLLLLAAATVVTVAIAVALSTRRDVGAGLRQTRPGAARASGALAHPIGLALRLHRGLLLGFATVLLLLGIAYGSILGELDAMLGSVEGIDEALAAVGGATPVESFLSLIMTLLAVFASVYVVLAALRARSEETAGRAEPLLATGLSRRHWLASHLAVAMIGGTGGLLLAGLGLGGTGALVLDDAALVPRLLGAALAYVPALWVTGGVAAALYGLAPRAATLAWVVPAYAFVVGYFGQLLQFPEWTGTLSPFAQVPQLPAEELTLAPLLVLLAIAAGLVAVGLFGFRHRGVNVT